MTCFLWILLAGAAMAQTAAPPPGGDKANVTPLSADKTAATPPRADKALATPGAHKTAATPPGRDKAAVTPLSADKTAATPPRADKALATPPGADKTAATPPSADKFPVPAPAKPAETFQSAMAKQLAAVATQRAAVRRQSELAVPWMLAPPEIEATPGSEAADCAPVADPELTPLIDSAAKQHQVEPKLLRGVIEQESGFHACAISPKGAKGLMQLMPATIEQFKVGDAFDPKQNIEAGATYLRQLLDKYKGDLKLTLAAYNAGPANVDKTGGIPDIKETQDYVEGIMKKIQ